jgi:hypothetical protein
MDKNTKRGIISNALGSALLFGIGRSLGLMEFCGIALAVQWGVFLIHGFPQSSEKFYDASGSMTHFALGTPNPDGVVSFCLQTIR